MRPFLTRPRTTLAAALVFITSVSDTSARPSYITGNDDECGLKTSAAVGSTISGMGRPKVKDNNAGTYCKLGNVPQAFEGGKSYTIEIMAAGFPGARGAASIFYYEGGDISNGNNKCATQRSRTTSKSYTWVAPKGYSNGETVSFKVLCGHYSAMYRAADVTAVASGNDLTTTSITSTTTTTISTTTTTVSSTTTTGSSTTTTTTATSTTTTTVSTTTTTTIYDEGNVDCVERWDPCTKACEASSARNYEVITPTNKLGKQCIGATSCIPGEDECPPTTTVTTRTTTTVTTTITTTSTTTVTSTTTTTTTDIYHARFMGLKIDLTEFLCINKDWDATTCHPGGPVIKDLILTEYTGADMFDVWNEGERKAHMNEDQTALRGYVLTKLAEMNPDLTADATAKYIKCGAFECTTTTSTSTSTTPAITTSAAAVDGIVGAAAAELAAAKAALSEAEANEASAISALKVAQSELERLQESAVADDNAVAAAEDAVEAATAAVATAKAAVASAAARVEALEAPAPASKVGLAAGLVAGITAVLGAIFAVQLLRAKSEDADGNEAKNVIQNAGFGF